MTTRRSRRFGAAVVAIALVVVVLAACTPVPPGDFYDAPQPLPAGRPGEVIWTQGIAQPKGSAFAAFRVMYHSRDSQNHDVATTGTVYFPKGPAPAGGWPVIAFDHGTSGMAPACAPSRRGAWGDSFGVRGVVVAPDYIGLGPNGQLHSYLSGLAEGRATVDLVRAARNVSLVNAGSRWATVGVSQGGHASLWAGQVAATYARELELVGVVAVAPGSELLTVFPGDTQLFVDVISVMALYGMAVDHPIVQPADYVTPRTAEAAKLLATGCLVDFGAALAAIPHDQVFTHDPRTTSPASLVGWANNPGNQPTAAPIVLVQGTADTTVLPARTEALRQRLCTRGDNVSQVTVDGGTHDSALGLARPQITPWLLARFAGEPATSTC